MSSNALPEQALAFYRTPARYLEFRDPGRPLCGDAGPLLRLTCGTTPDALSLPPGLASADEWQAAARFFVQQVLLAPGADNYRLLGVTPQAKDVEIKTHHRLLMRLLHPDREHTDEAWHTAAAARINQAYATLRDPEKRAEYNGQLIFDAQQARAAPGAPPAAPAPVRRPMQHSGRRQSGDTPLRRYVWRHLPQVSLAGSIVLASAWIGWIWLNNAPSAALGGGENGGTIVALQADVARPLPPVAVSLTAAESEPLRVVPPAPLPEMAPVPSTPPAQKPVTEAAVVAPVATSPRATAPNQPTVPAVPISKGTPRRTPHAPLKTRVYGLQPRHRHLSRRVRNSHHSTRQSPRACANRPPRLSTWPLPSNFAPRQRSKKGPL